MLHLCASFSINNQTKLFMKKMFIGCALLAAALSSSAQEKQNVIKVNLFSPIVKTGSFFFERAISEKSSAQIGIGFTAFNRDEIKLNGIFITPEYRFYLSESEAAPVGFYVGPYLRYQNLKIETTDSEPADKATLSTFGGGVVVGRQWIFSDIVALDIFLGPNYNSGKVKVTSGSNVEDEIPGAINGFGVRAGVTLGIAF